MSSPLKFNLTALGLIILIGSLIYANSLNTPFQFDDKDFIVGNTSIQNGLDIPTIWNGRWAKHRFIPLLTFALNHQWSRLNTFSYHAVNILIHLFNAVLVWQLLLLLLKLSSSKREEGSDHHYYIALSASLLFLAHPLQTQAVTYISQRFTSLAALFYLSSLLFYVHGRSKDNMVYLGLGFAAGMMSMFSKQIAFTLPFNFILLEWLILKKATRGKHTNLIIVMLVVLALIIPFAYKFNISSVFVNNVISVSHQGDVLTVTTYLLTQLRVILKYFLMILLPWGQNIHHDVAASSSLISPITTLICLLLIASSLVLAYRWRRKNPLLSYGLFWYYLCLSVESSVIVIQHVMFEHRVYLPSVGIFLIISLLIFEIKQSLRFHLMVISLIVLILSVLTVQRNTVWQSRLSLWKDAAQKSPNLLRPHVKLGVAYLDEGKFNEALREFIRASEIAPDHPGVIHNVNLTLQKMRSALLHKSFAHYQQGQWREALTLALKAQKIGARIAPNYLRELLEKVSQP